ncbi:Metallo-beta-lactamase family protein, related [Neospora caninum Liverpool]|uniref:Metallo-beta-lactamase family protein, related n=1 Tax=Neospora caninum (strain Liverpool) TaxID=572307 RepID=F0VQE0_NEOCL|nr:Metallo-beta-lactamase family protein, related [Neospora caninum Liverpool]CBZ55937.1 Metallo-beta-lactamase family protein, related [Neospora caninum Liverpool]CEL70680.1 TPA: Metallo-beta-lactamase family protein, related [Neospora caninum Liverpool]|eukprot:XP_003885963.1 Metallo-beta-lactamase family protein, related [Neospora caninum Liverpool]
MPVERVARKPGGGDRDEGHQSCGLSPSVEKRPSISPGPCPLSEFPSCSLTPLFAAISLPDEDEIETSLPATFAGGEASAEAEVGLPAPHASLSPKPRPPSADGLLFLGTGVSCALPQLGHVLPMASPSHPFFPFLRVPVDQLPSTRVLHRLAAQHAHQARGATDARHVPGQASAGIPGTVCREKQQTPDGSTNSGPSSPAASGAVQTTETEEPSAAGEGATRAWCSGLSECGEKPAPAEEGGYGVACVSCFLSWKNGRDVNHRNNVSAVLRIAGKSLLIDCGKTFREAALAYFPLNHISALDAVLLTHDHQDAVGGIDDLRDLQRFTRPTLAVPACASTSALSTQEPAGLQRAASSPTPNSVNRASPAYPAAGSLWGAEQHGMLNPGDRVREALRKSLGYRPESLLHCYVGPRTLHSLCSKFKYIVQTSWRMQKALLDARDEEPPRPAAAAAGREMEGKKRRLDKEATQAAARLPCHSDATVHEEGVPGLWSFVDSTDAPVLQRKVACLAFHLLNDRAPSPSVPTAPSSLSTSSLSQPSLQERGKASSIALASSASAPASRQDAPDTQSAPRDPAPAGGASLSGDGEAEADLNCMWRRLPPPVSDDAGFSTLRIPGVPVPIQSFPVYHGGTYVSLGFLVGDKKLVYISDVTSFPTPVLDRLRHLDDLETLVVDAIGEKLHNAHFSVQEALALAVLLQPRNVFLVGMSCSLEHRKTNRRLAIWLRLHQEVYRQQQGRESRIESVSLALDGLFVPMRF